MQIYKLEVLSSKETFIYEIAIYSTIQLKLLTIYSSITELHFSNE